jgi:hypothetical protein
MSKHAAALSLIIIASIVAVGCNPTPVPTPPPAPTTPCTSTTTIGPITVAVTNPNDVSSISIPSGTWAQDHNGAPWCNTGLLSIAEVSVNNLVGTNGCFTTRITPTPPAACTPYNALAALDVGPNDVAFNYSSKPTLRYDLTANPPKCKELNTGCGGFGIYQLFDPIPPAPAPAWRYVGSAFATTFNSTSVAQGDVFHFSIYALVELPSPRPVTPPSALGMTVASVFDQETGGTEKNAFRVSLAINTAQPDMKEVSETRLFRFSQVVGLPVTSGENLPPECLNLGTAAQQLTCLFPIDMLVTVALGPDSTVLITSVAKAYSVKFVANVEIY